MLPTLRPSFRLQMTLATLTGFLGALAFPDPGIAWLGFVAWVPLLVALDRATVRRGAALGFVAGLTFFGSVLHWLVALTVAGTIVVVAYLALFIALFGAVSASLVADPRGFVVVPFAWTAIEWVRSWAFTGFGWGSLGYALAGESRLVQAAALGGVPLLSLAVMATNAALAVVVTRLLAGRRPWGALVLAAGFPAALAAYGEWALRSVPETGERLRVAVVSGDLDPYVKWSAPLASLERYVGQTEIAMAGHPDLVVWPETAIPQPIQNERIALIGPFLRARALKWGTSLLVGAPEVANENVASYWNGAVLVRSDGTSGPGYRKRHLVPFGEYTPFGLGGFWPRVVPGYDYVAGEGGGPFPVGDARVGVLICFEDVFSGEAIARAGAAGILASMSNDAWFGIAEQRQHLQVTVLRAVETGRSIARAANGGISALIDPYGRIQHGSLEGFPLASLPIATRRTGFARAPALVPLVALGALMAALARRLSARARRV